MQGYTQSNDVHKQSTVGSGCHLHTSQNDCQNGMGSSSLHHASRLRMPAGIVTSV
jgi:hypothetical protein